VRDAVSAVVGGAVGTVGIVAVLFAGDVLSGYRARPFAVVATYVLARPDATAGLALFAALGAVGWPFVFLAFRAYLPGRGDAARGVAFAVALWVGSLVLLVAAGTPWWFPGVALVGHLAYGGLLGLVYGRLGDHALRAGRIG